MQTAYKQIIKTISKIYQRYDQEAKDKNEDKMKKSKAKMDNNEKQFIEDLNELEKILNGLQTQMKKYPHFKGEEGLSSAVRDVYNCITYIQKMKKKTVMFKVNDAVTTLVNNTKIQIPRIKQYLQKAGSTKCLCFGTDGQSEFKQAFEPFKRMVGQWQLLSTIEPKDSVENYIGPKFKEDDFEFVKDVMKKNWPQPEQKIVEKIVVVNNGGKPNLLSLANQYIYGINRQENPQYGLKIYTQQADNNSNPSACSFLGQVYQQGTLLARDFNNAIKYYQKAMNGKEPYASYRFAMALIQGTFSEKGQSYDSIEKAYKILMQAATELESGEAYVQLGVLYETGNFSKDKKKLYTVEKDLKKAINYYNKARSLHVPRASNNLGVLYFSNRDMNPNDPKNILKTEANITQNVRKSLLYLQQAKNQGLGQAFYNIGSIYEKGLVLNSDPQKVLNSYYQGGLKGDIKSRIKFAFQIMNQTTIVKEQYQDHYRLAIKWLQAVINKLDMKSELKRKYNGNPEDDQEGKKDRAQALFYLGLAYEYGFGVQKSQNKAFSYYLQSADLQYPSAKNKLGDSYFSGFGCHMQDMKIAIGLYKQAAQMENSQAMVNLGSIYLNGVPGVENQNYYQALRYFKEAVKLQNSDALIHLSFMYRNGFGCQVDQQTAKQLLQQAARMKNSTAIYMLKSQSPLTSSRSYMNQSNHLGFVTPSKINLKQIIPIISQIPSNRKL